MYRAGDGPGRDRDRRDPRHHPEGRRVRPRVVETRVLTVFMPHLFGEPGAPGHSPPTRSRSIVPACVSKEFAAFAPADDGAGDRLAASPGPHAHERCGGPGVGAVGMCFTGGFALGMMVDEPACSRRCCPSRRCRSAITKRRRPTSTCRPTRPARGEGAGRRRGPLRARAAVHRRPAVPAERFATLRARAGRPLHRRRDRLVEGQPLGIPRSPTRCSPSTSSTSPAARPREALDAGARLLPRAT